MIEDLLKMLLHCYLLADAVVIYLQKSFLSAALDLIHICLARQDSMLGVERIKRCRSVMKYSLLSIVVFTE